MASMHSYGVNNQAFRRQVLGWIASVAFLLSLQSQFLIELFRRHVFGGLAFLNDVPPISVFTVLFTLCYLVFDRFLWKLSVLDRVPNLSGTWVGMASNPYFPPARLEVMQIDQTWTGLRVTVDIYEENEADPEDWGNATLLGAEHSTNARITECERKHCDFTFDYLHEGLAIGQSPFEGVMFLKYRRNSKRGVMDLLEGRYLNTKTGRFFNQRSQAEESFEGVVGRIALVRVSLKMLDLKDVLDWCEENGQRGQMDLFVLKKMISSQVRDIAKA
jgi:hypothetical protein